MSLVGLAALTLLLARPARNQGEAAARTVRIRLSWAAIVAGALAFPAVLTDHARTNSGYDFASAWGDLFDGSTAGLLAGLETFLPLLGALVLLPVALNRSSGTRRTTTVLTTALTTALAFGVIALGATRFPAKAPADWGRGVFETCMWMLHLIGGGVWVGGLIGLVLLVPRGGLDSGFWSAAIRRFSAAAMSCVAAIALSGLFLYWEHVDGPSQLFTTMYGRVLGVKILLFGSLLVLGAANQFWLHPRIEALRAAGDERPLRTLLVRRFPAVVGAEVVIVLALLFVAPFLHGSARNQAFQADAAKHAAAGSAATGKPAKLPKLGPKHASTATWIEGTVETAAVLAVTVAGYRFSGRLARRRSGGVGAAPSSAASSVASSAASSAVG
ncbi:MAG: copper resistance protein CopD [Catenulispora sp.]|nr:copper resistance protein CopD [Catenulispora sp.]